MTTLNRNDSQHSSSDSLWEQGSILELEVIDLSDSGDGVGRWQQRVVFIPDTVPGDRVRVRLVHVKKSYAHAKLLSVLTPSRDRIRPACIVADKCGGCQWQVVSYERQLEAKRNQVIQALERIGGFEQPQVEPVLAIGDALHYRNKATYPLSRNAEGQVQAGYYRKGSHRLVNLNQCPVQDERLNPLLAQVKQDIQQRGWSIYNEERHQGRLRHLSLRIGRRTGEILLTLVTTDWRLDEIEEQAALWLEQYPDLVGVALNLNCDRTNRILGAETRCVAGEPTLTEVFAGLQFKIQPTTFFQIYTEQTEALLDVVMQELNPQGEDILLDAYCGIGTLTLPLAQRVQHAIGIEVQAESVGQARQNATLNQIHNVEFQAGKVETCLKSLNMQPNLVLLDPPRKGCATAVLDQLRQLQPQKIAYISCNPATLARDLKHLCADGQYQFIRVQPADFFPQTAHVECAAFLELQH
ncbi:MAG: 23S rRNA (uracil(1939)-C(5))-methyltransferase RlmD [Thainema sp.]